MNGVFCLFFGVLIDDSMRALLGWSSEQAHVPVVSYNTLWVPFGETVPVMGIVQQQ